MRLLMEKWSNYLREAEDMKKVSKVILINDNDKVLILKRSARIRNEKYPWEWDLPGGHAEKGETFEQALDREVWEEVSLDIGEATKIYTDGYTAFFVSYDWEGKISLSHEHEDYKWINPEEITNYYIGEMYERAVGRIAIK